MDLRSIFIRLVSSFISVQGSNMTHLRKAVFPVAGFGTRFLPATKAMPKELLPILNKPLIQYAAEEAVAAGIDTLIFVTGRNKRAIEDHFDRNIDLELALKEKGQNEFAETISNILPKAVECIFVRQKEQLGLGHAILCAERAVGNEAFSVILADDLLLNDKNFSATYELIEAYKQSVKSQLLYMQVNGPSISNYGVLKLNENIVESIIEKPVFEEAPSNLASIGRYVLTPDIFECLRNITFGRGNEMQLTDGINQQAKWGNVQAKKFLGERYDCGSLKGFLDATNRMASIKNII